MNALSLLLTDEEEGLRGKEPAVPVSPPPKHRWCLFQKVPDLSGCDTVPGHSCFLGDHCLLSEFTARSGSNDSCSLWAVCAPTGSIRHFALALSFVKTHCVSPESCVQGYLTDVIGMATAWEHLYIIYIRDMLNFT